MKKFNSKKARILFIALNCILFSIAQNSYAKGETSEEKRKIITSKFLESQKIQSMNTDSLKTLAKTKLHQNDSISSKEKTSSTGASYNILFQVIYRNSFSEIFEEKK